MAIRHCGRVLLTLVIFAASNSAFGQDLQHELSITPPNDHDSIYYQYFKKYMRSDISMAKTYALKAYEAGKKGQRFLRHAKCINAVAYTYDKLNNKDSSLHYYWEGIRYAQRHNLPEREMFFYNDLGNLFERYDYYDSALAYYSKAFSVALTLSKPFDEAIARHNMGLVYYHLENYNEALKNILEAIAIKNQHDIKEGMELNLLNVGMIYSEQARFDDALRYLMDAKKLCGNNCDPSLNADINYRIGYCIYNKSGMVQAFQYYKTAIDLAKQTGNEMVLAHALLDMGKYNTSTGNYVEAIAHLTESSEIAHRITLRRLERDSYEALAAVYSKTDRLDMAMKAQTRYIELKDSIFNEKMANNLKDIQLDAARKLSDEIISQKDMELRNTKLVVLLIAIICVLALLILVLVYINRRNSLRIGKIAQEQLQEQIRIRTFELEKSNRELKDSQKQYDHLIYRTSHDIRGPIATILGLTNVGLIDKSGNTQVSKDYLSKIQSTANGLSDKLARLTQISNVKNSELQYQPIMLPSLIRECFDSFRGLNHFPLVSFQLESTGMQTDLICDNWIVQFILTKILDNSFRYYNPNNENHYIKVSISQTELNTIIDIEDNGYGIDETVKEKIFMLFYVASEVHGTGLGLFLARIACHRIGARVYLQNPSGPTIFRIELPNKKSDQMWAVKDDDDILGAMDGDTPGKADPAASTKGDPKRLTGAA